MTVTPVTTMMMMMMMMMMMVIVIMFCILFQTLFSQAFDLEARDYLNEDDQTVVKHRSW